MNKNTKIIIGAVVIAIVIIAVIAVYIMMDKNVIGIDKTTLSANSVEELSSIVDQIYQGVTVDLYNTQTLEIDLTDETSVKSYTGLENGEDIEYAVVSEPMISSQAHSLVLLKVKDGVNANEVAKKMSEGINPRKWICVSAKNLYATNSGNIVFLVMTENTQATTSIYESFKNIAGDTGEVYEKTIEDEPLPDDMILQIPE